MECPLGRLPPPEADAADYADAGRRKRPKAAGLIVQLLLYHPPQSRRSSGAPRNEAKMVEMGTNGRLQCGGVIPAEILLGIQG